MSTTETTPITIAKKDIIKNESFIIRKNFDSYHNKISIVNIVRDFFLKLSNYIECSDIQQNGIKNPNNVIEQYKVVLDNKIVLLTIKTFTPISIVEGDVVNHKTIQSLNENIEKVKKYFGLDFMLEIRSFCLNLITSATDHRIDTWYDEGEFSFKFSVPKSKLIIELLILN